MDEIPPDTDSDSVFLPSGTGYGVDVAEISARWDAVAGTRAT